MFNRDAESIRFSMNETALEIYKHLDECGLLSRDGHKIDLAAEAERDFKAGRWYVRGWANSASGYNGRVPLGETACAYIEATILRGPKEFTKLINVWEVPEDELNYF